jgi:hypothetical protein
MKKTFIKVTGTYACKNKLQKAIFENLKELDFTLCKERADAIKLINLAFNDAVKNYNGTAKVPELKSYISDIKTALFTVEDVIHISVYNTKNDLT